MVRALIPEELAKVKAWSVPTRRPTIARRRSSRQMSTQDAFAEFLTLPLYEEL
jgi:malate synthase